MTVATFVEWSRNQTRGISRVLSGRKRDRNIGILLHFQKGILRRRLEWGLLRLTLVTNLDLRAMLDFSSVAILVRRSRRNLRQVSDTGSMPVSLHRISPVGPYKLVTRPHERAKIITYLHVRHPVLTLGFDFLLVTIERSSIARLEGRETTQGRKKGTIISACQLTYYGRMISVLRLTKRSFQLVHSFMLTNEENPRSCAWQNFTHIAIRRR